MCVRYTCRAGFTYRYTYRVTVSCRFHVRCQKSQQNLKAVQPLQARVEETRVASLECFLLFTILKCHSPSEHSFQLID